MKLVVLIVVSQSTVPVRPKPDCVAPVPKVTAVPEPPKVKVEPDDFTISFTSILLILLLLLLLILLLKFLILLKDQQILHY